MNKYCLIQDDDYHWYVCPVDKVKDAQRYFKEVTDYWKKHDYYSHKYKGPIDINYIVRIDHPTSIKFTEYEIDS